MNAPKTCNPVMLSFLLLWCLSACNTNRVSDDQVVRFHYYQGESLTAESTVKLATFELDLLTSVELKLGAEKKLSVDSTSSISFSTWHHSTDNTDQKLFILLKTPDSWYSGFPVWPRATLVYGENNPKPVEGRVHAFFLEGLHPLPSEPIPLYIESDHGVDSLMVDPNHHVVPQQAMVQINRSMMPKMQDRPMLFVKASTPEPLRQRFIPVLMHDVHGGGGWSGVWTVELNDKTEDGIGTLPGNGITPDYKAVWFSFRK